MEEPKDNEDNTIFYSILIVIIIIIIFYLVWYYFKNCDDDVIIKSENMIENISIDKYNIYDIVKKLENLQNNIVKDISDK